MVLHGTLYACVLRVKQQLNDGKLSLGLLLGTEAPVMTPSGIDFSFLSMLSLMDICSIYHFTPESVHQAK